MVSVSKPLRDEQMLSKNRCYRIVVSAWIFGVAVAVSRLIINPTWNTDVSWFTSEAHSVRVAALVFVLYLVSLVCPGWLSPMRVCEFIFLVVVRAQVSAQVQSISGGVDELEMVILKAIRYTRNVLVIYFVALALCSSGSL